MQTTAAYAERDDLFGEIVRDKKRLMDFYGFLSTNRLPFYQCAQVFYINPNAKAVKTFDEWHETTDRRIKRGSKAIAVTDDLYPNRKRYYFDVSQTYGFREYKPTESITDAQLLDAVKSQSLWAAEVTGTYRDKLYAAVADYCENTLSAHPDGDAAFMKAVTDGVFTCVVGRYGKPQAYIQPEAYADLSGRDGTAAALRASRLSEALFGQITEYRSRRNERNAEQRRNGQSRKVNVAPAQAGLQQSLFDILDEIRVADTGAPSGDRAGVVHEVDAVGRPVRLPFEGAEGGGNAEGATDTGTAQAEPDADGSGGLVFATGAVREPNRSASARDGHGASDLPDYRLTEEILASPGGAKTRYKSNVQAIRLLAELDASGAPATQEQRDVLARYVGWGGIPQAFDERNTDWAKEYAELKSLLTEEEYRLARSSTLNAYYTPKAVVDAVYAALARMGFEGGSLLEPAMGTGHFVGLMPEAFNAKVYGAELDPVTGKIAKQLYPSANIQIKGFQDTDFPDGFFDGAVSNVPFGSYSVHDPKYNRHNLHIHDYFILKTLDKLREGGIAAIVTTKGTLDKANAAVRKLYAEKARLLGAVRLPNNAFKANAGTEVTADILFFQRVPPPLSSAQSLDWLDVGTDVSGVPVNGYYLSHPEMILGTMKKGKSMYGGEDETYCEPDGRTLSDALSQAIQHIPVGVYTPRAARAVVEQPEQEAVPADLSVKNYCYAVTGDKIYMRVDDEMVPQAVPPSNVQRLKAMVALREQVRRLLDVQLANCTDAALSREQAQLGGMYDRFVRQYGILNARTNKNLFRGDADYTLLIALENYDEATGIAQKTDIFSKRTIRKYTRPTHAETALEALHICKNETGRTDLRIIEELTGKDYDEVIAELDGHIYRNPEALREEGDRYAGWETAAEYLSGNVRRKLDFVRAYAKQDPAFGKNIAPLERVQPVPLTASEINVRLGVGWIDAEIYKQFLIEKFKIRYWDQRSLGLTFNRFTQSWKLETKPVVSRSFESTSIYGTSRMNGCVVFEHAINLQTPSIFDKVTDAAGNDKRVLNKPETIAVREKLRKIQEEFKAWIFDEPARRERLVAIYNERFNNTVLASYDGSYLTFPEMNPAYELKSYQKDAVARIITSGNTLLHHVVGAGKTFEVVATAMKLRQMKLASKPMIIVPNHLVLQWAEIFRTLYPKANLLIATEKDFEKENRLRFTSKIATGDWDAVIMAMSSFEKIPISQARRTRKIQEEINAVRDMLEELRGQENSRVSIKIMEAVLKNKEAMLAGLSDGKKDDLIRFEDLGVDYLFIDEAHLFKNKFIFTKMNNVAGISQAASKRSSDLDMKIDYLSELHGGQKGVVFATGTPTSNSMVEMYTMQSYLQRQDLAEAGLHIFDHWAAAFGETVTALELAPSGRGYRSKTRFAKFVNLPELLKMYRKFADVRTAEMLNLPVPKANKRVVNIKPTETVLTLCEVIADRAERINDGGVPPEVDNMLKITSDGKKLALDPRCFDRAAPDSPEHKVNICAETVFEVWKNTEDRKGTQLVFCDLSTPKVAATDYDPDTDFDVYNHLKRSLVQMGIPESEIAFIHDAKKNTDKQSLFDSVNAGKVRVLIGSTQKLGAGTNVQKRLVALHHLDTPYRPADMEQREGRAIRQGNENGEVDIYTYVTERTFDAYSYQILENKQRFISQVNRGELTVREAADIDETTLTYAEIKAITSANPLIKRKNEAETELGNLRVLESQYRRNRYALQDKVAKDLPEAVGNAQRRATEYARDIALRDGNKTESFAMTIAGRQYTERKDAAEILHGLLWSSVNAGKTVAVYKGFEVIPEPMKALDMDRTALLRGNGDNRVTVSDSATGTLIRIDNLLEHLEDGLQRLNERLQQYTAETEAAKIELGKPFEHARRIIDLSGELEKINAELDLDKKDIEPVIDDTKFKDEVRTETADGDGGESDGESGEEGDGQYVMSEAAHGHDYAMG